MRNNLSLKREGETQETSERKAMAAPLKAGQDWALGSTCILCGRLPCSPFHLSPQNKGEFVKNRKRWKNISAAALIQAFVTERRGQQNAPLVPRLGRSGDAQGNGTLAAALGDCHRPDSPRISRPQRTLGHPRDSPVLALSAGVPTRASAVLKSSRPWSGRGISEASVGQPRKLH